MKCVFRYIMPLLFCSCTIGTQRSNKIDLKNQVKAWDSITIVSLNKYSEENRGMMGKAKLISATFKNSNNEVKMFDRSKFVSDLDRMEFRITKDISYEIIEFNNSGESNSNKIFILVHNNNNDSCYSFVKGVNGNWNFSKKYSISKNGILKIYDFILSDCKNSNDIFWGNDINDILIVSSFEEDIIRVNPVMCLSKSNYKKIFEVLK